MSPPADLEATEDPAWVAVSQQPEPSMNRSNGLGRLTLAMSGYGMIDLRPVVGERLVSHGGRFR